MSSTSEHTIIYMPVNIAVPLLSYTVIMYHNGVLCMAVLGVSVSLELSGVKVSHI